MMTHPSRPARFALGTALFNLACGPRVPATIAHGEASPQPSEPTAEPTAEPTTAVEIVAATQLDGHTLRLQFSEKIVVPEAFDPNDFRISILAVHATHDQSNDFVSYGDLGHDYYAAPLKFVGATANEANLDLEFAPAVDQAQCRRLTKSNRYADEDLVFDYTTGLYLHYSAKDIPLRGERGQALADFGAEWVIAGHSEPPITDRTIPGTAALTIARALIPIACELPAREDD